VFLSFWRVSGIGDPSATDSEWKSTVVWMTAEWGNFMKPLLYYWRVSAPKPTLSSLSENVSGEP